MKKIINISIILTMIFSSYSIAQQQDLWDTFDKDHGLADNMVYTIIESNDRALWFGTNEGGASRLYPDGKWVTFNTANSGLINNWVKAIYESSDGILWFGTDGGVSQRNQDGSWKSFTTDNSDLVNDWVQAICESNDGALWFGTRGGVSRYWNGKWTTFTTSNGLADNIVNAILESSDGAMWFGTDAGANRYQNGIWETFDISDKPPYKYVLAIYESGDGALWFGTQGIIRYYNGAWNTIVTADELNYAFVRSIFESRDGSFWFGTDNGLWRYQGTTWTKYTQTNSELVSNYVDALCESSDGAMWFGTDAGVSRFQEAWWKTFTTTDGLADNSILNIIVSSDSALWFGTREGGASRYKDATWTTFNIANNMALYPVNAICESNDDALWLGTSNGAARYQGESWTTIDTSDGLANNYISAIYESSDRALWFGTGPCASRHKDGNWTYYQQEGLAANGITAICESNDGAMWFGTPERGVIRFQDSSWTTFLWDSNYVNYVGRIWDIYKSNDGALWFGSGHGGAIRFQDGIQTMSLTTADGLPSNSVSAIRESADGALWFGCRDYFGGGVSRYQDGSLITFTTADGLVSNDVTAVCESFDGALWFGTFEDGVSRLIPDRHPPFTFIIEGPENNDIIGTATPIFIFYGKDNRTQEEQLSYSYAVVDTSITPGSGQWSLFLTLTHTTLSLPNGTYTFSVRARDSWGNIDPRPATRTFTVDITQPTTTIEYPTHNDTICDLITIRGTVYDDSPIKDFKYYSIFYGKGRQPTDVDKWKILVDSAGERDSVRNDSLAILDTDSLELRGTYQLKLFAKDKLGHTSEDIITVHIVDVIGEIRNWEGGHVRDVGNNIEVYFPPNSFDHDMEIKINLVPDLNIGDRNKDYYRYADLAFNILPDNISSRKPGTLSITYADSNLANVADEKRLSIYHRESPDQWRLIGGTVDLARRKITTSITHLGGYALFENLHKGTESSISAVNVQPRVFSPQGGGFNTQAAISFMLGKDANVTIKIYNLAGRLVRLIKNNESMSYGNKVVYWDGKDKQGKFCPSDMYLVTIEALGSVKTKTVGILDRK